MENKEIYELFRGIDNVNDTTKIVSRHFIKRLSVAEVRLLQGENVDVHSDFHLSRCGGYTLSLAGSFSSVWSNDKICLAYNNGQLIQIHPDLSTTALMAVGEGEMSYETVSDGLYDIVYFTNGVIIGKLRNGVASILPATTNQFKSVLPAGNIIRFFQGSLYVVKGSVMFISDVLNKEIYDVRWGFKIFESEITMLESVRDGFFISDKDNVYFMERKGSTAEVVAQPLYNLKKIYTKGAVKGTAQRVTNVTVPSEKKVDFGVLWVSGNTLCLGGDGGFFEEIRSDIYAVPSSRIGTSMIRKSGDLNQYITIVR
jgi:hypothetical protein